MHIVGVTLLLAALLRPIAATPLRGTSGNLIERADPQLVNFPAGSEDIVKLLRGSKDAFVLAAYGSRLRATFPDIWNKYFPPAVHDAVQRVFTAITPDPDNPTIGGPSISEFRFNAIDYLPGEGGEDICGGGGEAYTRNEQDPNFTRFANCHVCDKSLDDSDPDEPLFLAEIDCEAFFDANAGGYRVTDEMNALGAVILHEMTHFNLVSGVAYDPNVPALANMDPTVPDNFGEGGALIQDKQEPANSPKATRQLRVASPELCIKNAENYVWLALESFWTVRCAARLQESNQPRFLDPDE